MRDCERGCIEQALERGEGQIGNAAAHLGMSRENLWERMKRLHIQVRAQAPEES